MRISDWSSDVCSSDLSGPDLDGIMLRNAEVIAQSVPPSPELLEQLKGMGLVVFRIQAKHKSFIIGDVPGAEAPFPRPDGTKSPPMLFLQIGRASCRERV